MLVTPVDSMEDQRLPYPANSRKAAQAPSPPPPAPQSRTQFPLPPVPVPRLPAAYLRASQVHAFNIKVNTRSFAPGPWREQSQRHACDKLSLVFAEEHVLGEELGFCEGEQLGSGFSDDLLGTGLDDFADDLEDAE